MNRFRGNNSTNQTQIAKHMPPPLTTNSTTELLGKLAKMESDVSGDEGLSSVNNKKKRTALENISNASGIVKEDVVKKQRFTASALYEKVVKIGSKQETNSKINKLTNSSNNNKIENNTSRKGGISSSKENLVDAAKKVIQSTKSLNVKVESIKNNTQKKISSSNSIALTTTTTKRNKISSSSSVESCSKLCDKLDLDSEQSNASSDNELIELTAEDIKGWEDIDAQDKNDVFSSYDYVCTIFKYYKQREAKFQVKDYLKDQPYLARAMRSLLVDWMVEVQQQLEFNHEVLYLAVKLLDLYLCYKKCDKDKLQLIGATSMFIACKFEERVPPIIDDFVYVSDNAFTRDELIKCEMDILKTLQFDIGAPLSYTFLRRYAKCLKADMKFLTLARYILELSLQEYTFVTKNESIKACAALYLAMKMTIQHDSSLNKRTNLSYNDWCSTLIHYTGYFLKDFVDLLPQMNAMLRNAPIDKHKTIFRKYSHQYVLNTFHSSNPLCLILSVLFKSFL